MRPEESGKVFYQSYTCVKTSWSTDLTKVKKGTLMWMILLPS